jgi:hypothetical protein
MTYTKEQLTKELKDLVELIEQEGMEADDIIANLQGLIDDFASTQDEGAA